MNETINQRISQTTAYQSLVRVKAKLDKAQAKLDKAQVEYDQALRKYNDDPVIKEYKILLQHTTNTSSNELTQPSVSQSQRDNELIISLVNPSSVTDFVKDEADTNVVCERLKDYPAVLRAFRNMYNGDRGGSCLFHDKRHRACGGRTCENWINVIKCVRNEPSHETLRLWEQYKSNHTKQNQMKSDQSKSEVDEEAS